MAKVEWQADQVYTYKVVCSYSFKVRKAMADVLRADPDADFRVAGDYTFKVRTKLTLKDMNKLLIFNEDISRVKKAWFF